MKGKSFDSDSWDVCKKELSENDIRVAIKDGPPSSMQDKLEDNQEYLYFLSYEYWCDLLSTIEVKDNSTRDATQINMLTNPKVAYHYDSDESIKVPRKKRVCTDVIPNRKQQEKQSISSSD